MTENKYTGEVQITLSGTEYTMRLTWAAIAQIQSELGDDALRKIYENGVEKNAKIIAYAINHPDVTYETVLNASPALAIIPTLKTLDILITYAYFGADGIPKEEAATDKKK